MNNFVFDITSLCRWTGSPTGMIRAEHELARYAFENRPDIRFSFYDSNRRAFLEVNREWVEILTSYSSRLLDEEQISGKARTRLLPKRRISFLKLEARRIRSKSPLEKALIEIAQRVICIGRRLPFDLYDQHQVRLDLVRFEDAIAGEIAVGAGDTLFLSSSDWWHKNDLDIAYIAASAQKGLRIFAICYDILPLIRPDWFGEPAGSGEDIKRFQAYWLGLFPHAHRIVVNSHRVRQDVIAYCAKQSIVLRNIDVVPLGSNPPKIRSKPAKLPAALEPGKFALYVSTIEPRKNHAHLLRCWQRLLDEGVPQRNNFKLVLVGRSGWKMDDVLAKLRDQSWHAGSVLHLEQLDDSILESLYASCAFCVYPSEYEGFGLPIVEAFARGKAVIASNGGSLPEVVGEFSPLLNPFDEGAWTDILRLWIEDPRQRQAYEKAIIGRSQTTSWAQVGSRLMELVDAG